ncbi:MAG: hypothetical protein ACE5R4_17135 [Armatimonadota bacterium]
MARRPRAALALALAIGCAGALTAGCGCGRGLGTQGQLEIYDIHLVEEVGAEGQVGPEVEVLSPRAEELHLTYRYRGASPGEKLACEWQCNDQPLPDLRREVELPAAQGSGRFDLVMRTNLPAGNWEARLRAREAVVATVGFRVAPEPPPPLITNVAVCEGVDDHEQPINPRRVFPPRAAAIYVRFDYTNAPLGERLTCQWSLEGEVISKATTTQEISATDGSGHFYLANPRREELPAGRYTVAILHRGRQVARADFEVAPEAEGGEAGD